jgi:hypothetical protein
MPQEESQPNDKGGDGHSSTIMAVLIILIIALFGMAYWSKNCAARGSHHATRGSHHATRGGHHAARGGHHAARGGDDAARGGDDDHGCSATSSRSVHAALGRLYSTADVDPLVTGQLYGHADNVRNVYAQRTSLGNAWGLTEYSSSGGTGDVGVDIGPNGLAEYGARHQIGYNDGIPEAWALPDTPVRWYRPAQRDYYGPEGPTVYSEDLFNLTEPDHDVLVN